MHIPSQLKCMVSSPCNQGHKGPPLTLSNYSHSLPAGCLQEPTAQPFVVALLAECAKHGPSGSLELCTTPTFLPSLADVLSLQVAAATSPDAGNSKHGHEPAVDAGCAQHARPVKGALAIASNACELLWRLGLSGLDGVKSAVVGNPALITILFGKWT